MKFITLQKYRINIDNITYYRAIKQTNPLYANPSYKLMISFVGDTDALSIYANSLKELDDLMNQLDEVTTK